MTTPWATEDLAEAWRALEGARLAGWSVSMSSSIDYGWECRATRVDGRRFHRPVRTASRNPVAAITELVQACAEADAA